jgi:tRNA dimethylallyltransferase
MSNPSDRSKPPLVIIVGPTAVGKTELSIALASRLGGEIVSADSRLFYRGMDIGTAKPTAAERAAIPHHLIDVADPDQTWSLAVFQQAAREAIKGINLRSHVPLLVGGTGQYIHAVTHGWLPPTVTPQPPLRRVLENIAETTGKETLHRQLAVLDPQAAAAIDPRNLRRTVRALEVILSSGRPFSTQRAIGETPYRMLTIGLTRPRPELYARLDDRIEAMFEQGFLEEVRNLMERGYSADLPSMSSIGYRECTAVLQGKMTLEEAKIQMKRLTRTFVRRQANWFKLDDPFIHWFEAGEYPLKEMENLVRDLLLDK